jgi:nucleotide-binding universal stress UspA family protein
MAASKALLVPVDFSPVSEAALRHATRLARKKKGRLVIVHVLPSPAIFSAEDGFVDYYDLLVKDAETGMKRLARRLRLKPRDFRWILLRASDTGLAIARQAKKSRASMIVMGSRGRTGLQRFMLGSVAERTLRYAECPVLIVKR